MKKVLLLMTVFASLGMVSCGGDEEKEEDKKMTVCDCVGMSEKMRDEVEDGNFEEVEEKYKKEMEECEKMFDDASEERQKEIMEEAEKC
jgi:hypothetical protein